MDPIKMGIHRTDDHTFTHHNTAEKNWQQDDITEGESLIYWHWIHARALTD